MKKKIEKFKVGDYVICVDSWGKYYIKKEIIYKVHSYNSRYMRVHPETMFQRTMVPSYKLKRFKKATKKEINDNLVDITVRKLKNEI